ncbi:MAG: histidinol-phosphate transaminase [Bordetella sp.]|nr:MAG: histidinol-phosphate transaminase [Bordetella sp.]
MNCSNINKIVKETIRSDIQLQSVYSISNADNKCIKLDAMESPYQLPDFVKKEIADIVFQTPINRYPGVMDNTIFELKSKIKENFNVPEGAEVIFGNGSDELINLIIQASCSPGDTIISPWPSFTYFNIAAKIHHASFIGVSLDKNLNLDLDSMLDAISKYSPKVVFLAIPNNPTGGLWSKNSIQTIVENAPGLVVLDEAYQPFTTHTWMPYVTQLDNVVVLRTLSKIGLAGLRVGYLSGRIQWLEQINKVRPPYNMNVLTISVLFTLLKYRSVIDAQTAKSLIERKLLACALSKLPGIHVFPSEGNFILFRFSGKKSANEIYNLLLNKKILIKNFSGMHPLLDNCLRVSVGTPEENLIFVNTLNEIIKFI